jgi:hypothetical protein
LISAVRASGCRSASPDFLARVRAQPVRDGGDDRRGREHPDLDRVGADVREHGIDLAADELGRQIEDPLDAE